MKKNKLIIMFCLAFIMLACETEDIDPGATANNELSGEWFVRYRLGADSLLDEDYTRIVTATTASESATDLIITDEDNFLEYRVKAKMDIPSNGFGSSDALVNFVEDSIQLFVKNDAMMVTDTTATTAVRVLVRNGVIIPDIVTTADGVKVDSIYFELSFNPGKIAPSGDTLTVDDVLNVSGYRRTGFDKDEH